MGLVELSPNGKALLVPITILLDGEFYDASAYKASPVPMALESGTVYEGMQAGVSQGLFTISSASQGNNTWIGNGSWQSASALAAAAAASAKKKETRDKPAPEPVSGPPVLRRAGAQKSKATEPTPDSTPPKPPPAPPAGSGPAATPPTPTSTAPTPNATTSAASGAVPPASADEEDPDRPVLKRGAQPPAEHKKPAVSTTLPAKGVGQKPAAATTSASASASTSSLQLIPAISDANGPEARPYTDDLKPDELDKVRKKILALAGDEVRARAAQLSASAVGSQPERPSAKPATRAKLPQPTFDDVQLHVFDLSNSNEPVLVLTAKARMPPAPKSANPDLQYLITLVAHEDIYGDLHKALANVTDTMHLDVQPRMELIDAVDADGDGRGELLFRRISDAGKAFVLYRVIGDQLWPLFQQTPGP